MVDYLVIGLGLAGVSLCHTLERKGKSFVVITDSSQRSSWVAGGLYNPVILKRFKAAWRAQDQMNLLPPFYDSLQKLLNIRIIHPIPVLRRFATIEEQNLWFEAADRPELSSFLSLDLHDNSNSNIDAPLGYGEVLDTGRVDTKALVEAYAEYLKKSGSVLFESLDFNRLRIGPDAVTYGRYKAAKVVFATGFGLKENPYFNYLPLQGTKGELITVKAPDLKERHVIKSSVFIIPLGADLYRVGATYSRKDKTNRPTEEGRKELLEKLNTFLKCDYEVIGQIAGIRPTVSDRRPLVGRHPKHNNLYVLNGFGSRGVMIGPFASQQLYNFMEQGVSLPEEMDIRRFDCKYKGE